MTFELGNIGGFELVICEIAAWQAIRAEQTVQHDAAEKREMHQQHAQHGESEQGEEDPPPLHRSDENE